MQPYAAAYGVNAVPIKADDINSCTESSWVNFRGYFLVCKFRKEGAGDYTASSEFEQKRSKYLHRIFSVRNIREVCMEQTLLPVSVLCHHALVDGRHIGDFYRYLEEEMVFLCDHN